MNVFTLYSEPHARNLRLWVRSWQENGYRPQLISLRELEGATIKQVVRRRGGGVVVRPGAVNLGHKRGKPVCKKFGAQGWKTAKVLIFGPETSADVLLNFLSHAS
jgi:hypothetical protein